MVRKVGNARIVREIGRGGMGVVYEAFQEELDRPVAVKALGAEAGTLALLEELYAPWDCDKLRVNSRTAITSE